MESLAGNVTLGHTLLLVASLMQDPTFVARIQETYDGVNSRVGRDIEYLAEHGGPNLGRQVVPLAANSWPPAAEPTITSIAWRAGSNW